MTSSIPKSEFVTDTMGMVLRIERRSLGSKAKSIFEAAESGKAIIYVPALVFAEIFYLFEKQRITASLHSIAEYMKQYPNCKEHPMNFGVIKSAAEITDIKELHDRLIAGAARLLDLELITNDPAIQASSFVKTVW
ncbi:MAG: PIN domain-containing protein [bacterium]